MEIEQKPRAALILDPDIKFHEEIKADPKAVKSPPFVALSGKEAQLTLAKSMNQIAGVFINPKFTVNRGEPGAASVIRFVKQLSPSTPIYIIFDGECPLSPEEVTDLGVRSALPKPITYSKMLDLVAPQVILFDPKAINADAKGAKDALGEETQAADAEFIPIQAKDFVSSTVTRFNLYVQAGAGRYVKILHTGDSFAPERLEVYIQKGLKYFYLRNEDQKDYLIFCNQIASKATKHAALSTEAKVSVTMNYGQETMSFLRTQGLSESNLYFASNFVEKVQSAVSHMKHKGGAQLSKFMDDVAAYEHGVATSMITAMLSKASGIESGTIVQIVGIASLLHNIGLTGAPKEVQDEDETKMTPEQKIQFYKHPIQGAEMLSKIPGTNPTVVQAVLQHHDRKNGLVLGTGNRVKNLNKVAEMIGIANEYLRLVPKIKSDSKFDWEGHLEVNVFSGFSGTTVELFRRVFLSN